MLCLLLAPLFLPFLLFRLMIKTLIGLVMIPFALVMMLVGLGFAALAVALAVAIPLMPLALIGFGVWALIRITSRPRVVHF
jgi:type IV secretory pathway TrbL component